MADAPLSLDALAETIERLTANRVYYLTSKWCPKVNEEGKEVLFKVPFEGMDVWVMHSTLLPKVEALAQREGIVLMEFDVEKFLRQQCVKLSLDYLDEASRYYRENPWPSRS